MDLLLAVAVACLAVLELWLNPGVHPRWAAAVTEVPAAFLLAWRRRLPVSAAIGASVALSVEVALGVPVSEPIVPLLVLVVTLYSLAVNVPLDRAIAGLAAFLFTSSLMSLSHAGAGAKLGNFLFGVVIAGGTWTAGRVVRARTQLAAGFAEKADRLETERLEAIVEERARIARELHDVIAHSVSVMVVQAGAAQEVLKRDPALAVEPLEAVQETGRQALVEMSRLVGLLREDNAELGLTPQPGLGDLDALLAQVREAGLPVDVTIVGERRTLPLGVDLSAYRVVQEALTNALKHAGRARAQVSLRFERDALEVEILDDGDGSGTAHSGGHGLVGMHARVSVFGGDFTAGPRSEGGFAVRARLPLGTVPA
jgi:signal transduction histidine kinase